MINLFFLILTCVNIQVLSQQRERGCNCNTCMLPKCNDKDNLNGFDTIEINLIET